MSDPEVLDRIVPRVPTVVSGDNGKLIATAAQLYIRPEDTVIDLTYGEGLFWTKYQPNFFLTNDLYKPAWLAQDYRRLPEVWTDAFDVVVFDPPYTSTGGTATDRGVHAMKEAYDMGRLKGWKKVFEDITLGIHESARIMAPDGRLFVKCCDYVESGKRHWGHRHVQDQILDAGLELTDEFIHVSGTGPQPTKNLDGSVRIQKHAHRAHSFLVVGTKKGKS